MFKNSFEALVFAYGDYKDRWERSTVNRMAAPGKGNGGLSGVDRAAQAGMIRAEVHELGKVPEAMIVARVSAHKLRCACGHACCSGWSPNLEWSSACAVLADHIRNTALAGCTANGVMRREYVVRYFSRKGERESVERLANRYGLDRHTVGAHYQRVANLLGGHPGGKDASNVSIGLEAQAMSRIEDRLDKLGLLDE